MGARSAALLTRGGPRFLVLVSSCVRGMRIPVTDVLDLLASGLTAQQVLAELPNLEPDEFVACLRFASRRLDHPILAA